MKLSLLCAATLAEVFGMATLHENGSPSVVSFQIPREFDKGGGTAEIKLEAHGRVSMPVNVVLR